MRKIVPAKRVIMVEPTYFAFNHSTYSSNPFQQVVDLPPNEISKSVHNEFNSVISSLKQHGIEVDSFPSNPNTPDAVFPNNWISLDPDGRLTLFPMLSENRQSEYQPMIVDYLRNHFEVKKIIDLRSFSKKDQFLEGTGSLVMDHDHQLGFACVSPRTHPALTKEYLKTIGYDAFLFYAEDQHQQAIYHTNVVMSIGPTFAVLCAEMIPSHDERNQLLKRLKNNEKEPILLTSQQIHRFAANCICLQTSDGPSLFMSRTAYRSLDHEQIQQIQNHLPIVAIDIPTIETVGGGSLRCMICENFLKKKGTLGEVLIN